jgi:polyisoprenoid-binding protein YceI
MAVPAGLYRFGSDHDRLVLQTARDGMAAQAGHDLTIEAARWSGELTVGDDLAPVALEVRVDMGALIVRAGSGGLKPLTDRDKREIGATARKLLASDRNPEAVFTAATATAFKPDAAGGGIISGTLTLRGTARPLEVTVTQPGPDRYHASGSLLQSAFGIKPYSAFLGTLKVRDEISFEADIDMTAAAAAAP